MTGKQKYTVLFFLGVLSAGLVFISISRLHFYNEFVNVCSDREEDRGQTYYMEKESSLRASQPEAAEKIDLNSAGTDKLIMVPGIGRETALKILEYRLQRGEIQHVEELIRVKGIGPKKLEMIKKYVIIK